MIKNKAITMKPAKRNRRISFFVLVLDLATLMRRKIIVTIQYSLLNIINIFPENKYLKNPVIVSIINYSLHDTEKDEILS
jgi:uncharacterized protein YegL